MTGAGEHLEGLGAITGMALDDTNGNLVLLGDGAEALSLPPLRIDDVVTIFRAVYEQGRAPTVTIDPLPHDPNGPVRDIKHEPGTDGTYVGWILYQCDRLMKAYMLGEDNISGAAINSNVPGYREVLKQVFFDNTKEQTQGNWERFWIVPENTRRFEAKNAGEVRTTVSLFQVRLGVLTQTMKWTNGALVDDLQSRSSPGAQAFSTWFSQHYDAIAQEVTLTPPKGSGLTGSVQIFSELQRLATITAIAEHLRDSHIPMPIWMRNHKVTAVQIDRQTPSLTITKTHPHSGLRARIFGGVNLAAADQDKLVFAAHLPTENLGKDGSRLLQQPQVIVDELDSVLPDLVAKAYLDGPIVQFDLHAPDTRKAVILPGPKALRIGANKVVHSDMSLDLGRGHSLELVRFYDPNLQTSGPFGRDWALNLPRLDRTPLPRRHDRHKTQFTLVPHLRDDTGTLNALFVQMAMVAAYGARLPVADGHPDILGLTGGQHHLLGENSTQVHFKGGTVWHFGDDGRFLLSVNAGIATRYIYDAQGQLHQIAGYIGKPLTAEIRLRHDEHGRVVSAVGRQVEGFGAESTYSYDEADRLTCAKSAQTCAYSYTYVQDGLRTVTQADGTSATFNYDTQGRLELVDRDGQSVKHQYTATLEGRVLNTVDATSDHTLETWHYDPALRPIRFERGPRHIERIYDDSGGFTQTESANNVALRHYSRGPDGRQLWQAKDKRSVEIIPLKNGSVLLEVGGDHVLSLDRHPDGRLSTAQTNATQITPRYDRSGLQTGELISAPITDGTSSAWTETFWDTQGRVVKLTDASGWTGEIKRDAQGRPTAIGRRTKSGDLLGVTLNYDALGRVIGLQSSWGEAKLEFAQNGQTRRLQASSGQAMSDVQWNEQGLPLSIRGFDGAETRFSYASIRLGGTSSRVSLPNGLVVEKTVAEDTTSARAVLTARNFSNQVLTKQTPNSLTYRWGDR